MKSFARLSSGSDPKQVVKEEAVSSNDAPLRGSASFLSLGVRLFQTERQMNAAEDVNRWVTRASDLILSDPEAAFLEQASKISDYSRQLVEAF